MVQEQNSPDAEIAYEAFKSIFGGAMRCLDRVQTEFQWTDVPGRKIDPRVSYPLDMTLELSKKLVEGDKQEQATSSQVGQFLHAFGNYRRTRTVYTIDRTLFSHLVRSKWPKDIPVSAAALPKNGCILDLPAHEVFGLENIQGAERIQIACTYDMNHDTGNLDLLLTAFCIHRGVAGKPMISLDSLTAWLDLSAPSLEDAILNYAIYMEGAPERVKTWVERGDGDREALEALPSDDAIKQREALEFSPEWFLYLKSILSVLLYINGNEDQLETTPPPLLLANRAARRRLAKVKPASDPADPPLRTFNVGRKFASVIKRWEEKDHNRLEGDDRTIRPHLRAAHAHKYRVGPGRAGILVRFLPPIPVKGWEAPEEIPANRLVI